MLSRVCACFISRFAIVPVISSMRSARVDLPWSICAIIQKFLIDIMYIKYLLINGNIVRKIIKKQLEIMKGRIKFSKTKIN